MSEIPNVLYPPKEQDTCVSHRRYDGKERLIAWSVRDANHFLVFHVNAFREVTLADCEKLDVPETIQCRFSEQEIEPNTAFADECSVSSDTNSNPELNGPYVWSGRAVDADTQLEYTRARCYDPTVGRWLTGDPLQCDMGDDNRYPFPDRAEVSH